MGFAWVYLFFLFLIQNIDCGYYAVRRFKRVPTIYVLSKNIKIFQLKFSISKAQKISVIAWASFRNGTIECMNIQ